MNKPTLSEDKFNTHRRIATQLESIYFEVNKLATKKPTERTTPMVSKKINHIIVKIKELIVDDEFLDAIETIPVEGNLLRLDELLILLGELRGIMDKQWSSKEFREYVRYIGTPHISQVM